MRKPNKSRFIKETVSNVKTTLIEITEDKLTNILNQHEKDSMLIKQWQFPFSLFITLLFTVLTASFNDAFGIDKEIWSDITYLALFAVSIWLFATIIGRWRKKSISLAELMARIKNEKKVTG